jgi:hypothetical protein
MIPNDYQKKETVEGSINSGGNAHIVDVHGLLSESLYIHSQ